MTHPLIHKLRKHPEHVRRKILYVSTVVAFAILFGLWSLGVGYTITEKPPQTASAPSLQPFAMLKASVVESTSKLHWPFSKSTTVTNPDPTTDTTTNPALYPTTDINTTTNDTMYTTPNTGE